MMMDKVKLFCVPYAGGSAMIYNKWKSHLPDYIELCPIELAGRGSRIAEPFYTGLEAAVEDIYATISVDISNYDYAFFGHSMGALLVYEVLQKIKALGNKLPLHAFFSGRKPPHAKREKIFSSLSTEEFEKEIMSLGGTPPDLFKHPELKEIFVPILRSDFKISETVVERPEISKLPFDISALVGKEEFITSEEAEGWQLHTSGNYSMYTIKGGHFFLLEETKAVTKIINQTISHHMTML